MLDPADLAGGEPNLNTVRMMGRASQNILNYAAGQFASWLILFLDNADLKAGLYVVTESWVSLLHI